MFDRLDRFQRIVEPPTKTAESSQSDRTESIVPHHCPTSIDPETLYIKSIQKDLEYLLNTANHDQAWVNPDGSKSLLPSSVVNYGLRHLIGDIGTIKKGSADYYQLESNIIEAIQRFEPRIIGKMKVELLDDSDSSPNPKTVSLKLTGEVRGGQHIRDIQMRTQIDMETGECKVLSQD